MKYFRDSLALPYILIAGFSFNIPLILFVYKANYTLAWLPFIGNFFFLFVVSAFVIARNKTKSPLLAMPELLKSGNWVSLFGALTATIISFGALLALDPGLIFHASPLKTLHSAPANMIHDKTGGMIFIIFISSTLGNLISGSFAAIVLPFILKRNSFRKKLNQGAV